MGCRQIVCDVDYLTARRNLTVHTSDQGRYETDESNEPLRNLELLHGSYDVNGVP